MLVFDDGGLARSIAGACVVVAVAIEGGFDLGFVVDEDSGFADDDTGFAADDDDDTGFADDDNGFVDDGDLPEPKPAEVDFGFDLGFVVFP